MTKRLSNLASSLRLPRLLGIAGGALVILSSTPAFAALGGHSTAYTPRGTFSSGHFGACGGGSCSHAGGIEGPHGGLATNSGTVTRTAPGSGCPAAGPRRGRRAGAAQDPCRAARGLRGPSGGHDPWPLGRRRLGTRPHGLSATTRYLV